MHLSTDQLLFSATDLANHLGCEHLTTLETIAARGGEAAPYYPDPALEVLRERGREHEARYLARLKERGLRVVELSPVAPYSDAQERWSAAAAASFAAMESGADVIYQATLFDGGWLGRPDFLVRVERASRFGAHSYEVVDTKLSRYAKAGAVLQIALYSQLLGALQGVAPESMHLVLGGLETPRESFRFGEFAAFFRKIVAELEAHVGANEPRPTYPEPVAQCSVCDWALPCRKRRREDDHLSLVAGITQNQRERLTAREVSTMTRLGHLALPLEPKLEGVARVSLERVVRQARLQVEGREKNARLFELIEPLVEGQGLLALPAPSPGDLFFDIEGDPYALEGGLEYLLGIAHEGADPKEEPEYRAFWGLSHADEKAAFERFIDFLMERRARWPDLHVYHYAAYEKSAVTRMMGRHATREDQVDELLRAEVFVDLYRVVRQGLRASVESYSIKKLEPFYGFSREEDLRDAGAALAHFEAWLELGARGDSDRSLLEKVETYNRDDCLSALALRNWLEAQRAGLERKLGSSLPRPAPDVREPAEDVLEHQARIDQLFRALIEGLPESGAPHTPEQHARYLLAHLLEFHRREKKSMWWEYHELRKLSAEELIENRSTLGGLEYEGIVDSVNRSDVHRYRFPRQEHGIRVGSVHDPHTRSSPGTVVGIDDAERYVDIKRGKKSEVPHPAALIPYGNVPDVVLRESLAHVAECVIEHGFGEGLPYPSLGALLLREAPRVGQAPGAALVDAEKDVVAEARRLATKLERTVLPVQGPPGSGKTYIGAHMILELLSRGKKVGVTATSHKVVGNLLEAVCREADKLGVSVSGIQKAGAHQRCEASAIEATDENAAVDEALASGSVRLAGGVPWLWARAEMRGSVDVLFIDEAGQFSLANTVAVAPAAESLVLLGDPRQLDQPQQGVHPPGTDVSGLGHLLGDALTMPADRGLFLDHTWRLHPAICTFTSETFYSGRLLPRSGLEQQRLDGPAPLDGSGLRFVEVLHSGNTNESPEEVATIVELVSGLLDANATWTNAEGLVRRLTLADVLIVAPYNAQVSALARALPSGARIGTVDKFQGQEAPLVFYSLTTSTPDDAPRGMEFLYSENRLNVATSRARCLAVIVASPALFSPRCRTPEQMRLANGFCAFLEGAGAQLRSGRCSRGSLLQDQ